jgi:hypothetical protein
VPSSVANGGRLSVHVTERFDLASTGKHLPDPFRDGQTQSFSQVMSLCNSWR